MSTQQRDAEAASSRREALRFFAALPLGTAMLTAGASTAWAKAAQKAVQYQDEPKKDRNCAGCRHFQPPNACKLVEGDIIITF